MWALYSTSDSLLCRESRLLVVHLRLLTAVHSQGGVKRRITFIKKLVTLCLAGVKEAFTSLARLFNSKIKRR